MASRPEITENPPSYADSDGIFINKILEERWQIRRAEQIKNNTPEPLKIFLGFGCPDCKNRIEGEIVSEIINEIEEEYPIKTYILYKCVCGYEYAELEEGRETSFREFFMGVLK